MHPDVDEADVRDPMMGNKVEDNSDTESEADEDELDDEEYENQIKEDILRPASTRSKVVVNLREPPGQKKGKKKVKQLPRSHVVIYDIDPYDAVRMKLLLPNQALWNAYVQTITDIEKDINAGIRSRMTSQAICLILHNTRNTSVTRMTSIAHTGL